MLACLVWGLCVFKWVRCVFDVCTVYPYAFLCVCVCVWVCVGVCVCVCVYYRDIGSRGESGWNAEVRVCLYGRQAPLWGDQGNVKPSLQILTKYSNYQPLCAHFCFGGLCRCKAERAARRGQSLDQVESN